MPSRETRQLLRNAVRGDKTSEEIFNTIYETTGSTIYVSSVVGKSTNGGNSSIDALATLDQAMDKCTANSGDIVILMPGHVEDSSAAATWDIDVAGVTVVGMGRGPDRPRFDFNDAAASIDIGANGCALRNVTLRPSVATVSIGIDVEAAVTDTLLEDIEFLPGEEGDGTDEFVLGIDVKAGCTRTHVKGLRYRHHASADGAASAVKFTGASDDCTVEDFDIWITGTAAVAGINGDTTLSTRMTIRDGRIVSDAEPGIELLTGTTGVIENVMIFSNLATINAAIVADGCAFFENYYVEVGDESGVRIGTQSADD